MGQLAEIFSGIVIRPGAPEKIVQIKTSNLAPARLLPVLGGADSPQNGVFDGNSP
jgi:hypothetical protein